MQFFNKTLPQVTSGTILIGAIIIAFGVSGCTSQQTQPQSKPTIPLTIAPHGVSHTKSDYIVVKVDGRVTIMNVNG